MAHKATEIANEFIKRANLAGARLTQMQLQKLTYIAHGWTLALTGQPLSSDSIEAWDYGPVFPDLYDHTRFFGKEAITRFIRTDDNSAARFFGGLGGTAGKPYEATLSSTESAIIDHVWSRYGRLTAFQLSDMTHQPDTPWFNTYSRQKRGRIPDDVIRTHYKAIAENARRAL